MDAIRKAVIQFLLGQFTQAGSGELDTALILGAARNAIAAGLLVVLSNLDRADYGMYDGLVAAVVAFVADAVRRWNKDYTPEPTPEPEADNVD